MGTVDYAAFSPKEYESAGCISEILVDTRVNKTIPFTIASSLLSLLGSLLTVITFVLWRDLRKSTARQILLFLAIADFFTAAGYFAAGASYSTFFNVTLEQSKNHSFDQFCAAQSFVVSMFSTASFFWTTYLAVYFVLVLVFGIYHWGTRLLVVFNITAWSIPLIICSAAVALGYLGVGETLLDAAPGICFVSSQGTIPYNTSSASTFKGGIAKFLLVEALCMKLWEVLAMIAILVCYLVIFGFNRCFLHQLYQHPIVTSDTPRSPSSAAVQHPPASSSRASGGLGSYAKSVVVKSIKMADVKFLVIPVVFILFRLWGTLRYFISMWPACHQYPGLLIGPNNTVPICVQENCFEVLYHPILLYAQAIFDPLQGFGNAILFIFLSRVIMRRLLSPVRSCCRSSACALSDLFRHKQTSNLNRCTNEREPLIQRSYSSQHRQDFLMESSCN